MKISLQFGHAWVTMMNNNILKHSNMSKNRNEHCLIKIKFSFFFKDLNKAKFE